MSNILYAIADVNWLSVASVSVTSKLICKNHVNTIYYPLIMGALHQEMILASNLISIQSLPFTVWTSLAA